MEKRQPVKIKKYCRFAFLLLTVFSSIKLLAYVAAWSVVNIFGGISFSVSKASTIGIIGGADGPTAIFVTTATAPVWQFVLMLILLIVGIGGFLVLKKR